LIRNAIVVAAAVTATVAEYVKINPLQSYVEKLREENEKLAAQAKEREEKLSQCPPKAVISG
jgi:hypothetical protein